MRYKKEGRKKRKEGKKGEKKIPKNSEEPKVK